MGQDDIVSQKQFVYAGIGSRRTPNDILLIMEKFAEHMGKRNHVLRSGGADGADLAFEVGAKRAESPMEIYLPWKGFNGNLSPLFYPSPAALDVAAQYHPAWQRLSEAAKKLMARNSHQILGLDLKTPCDFVVCWTPDGYNQHSQRMPDTGGTGQAIDIAIAHNIPVYNIKNAIDLDTLRKTFSECHTAS